MIYPMSYRKNVEQCHFAPPSLIDLLFPSWPRARTIIARGHGADKMLKFFQLCQNCLSTAKQSFSRGRTKNIHKNDKKDLYTKCTPKVKDKKKTQQNEMPGHKHNKLHGSC